jgi:hypothetical protein
MKTREAQPMSGAVDQNALAQRGKPVSHLLLVTEAEVRDLQEHLARGSVPMDLQNKLRKLAAGSLGHCFIEQNCRSMVELLLAHGDGSFVRVSPEERDGLLRALAYVRKDEDAIPDYQPNGYADDQQELRKALTEFGPLLQSFKAWRLQHQVPAMWV